MARRELPWCQGVLSAVLVVASAGCGDDEGAPVTQRGLPGATQAPNPAQGRAKPAAGTSAKSDAAGASASERPAVTKRPRPVLAREDFSLSTRDPFQNFLGAQIVELEPDRPRAQRNVRLPEYNFEDLKLVAIVHSGRAIVPRALFLASDGKSKTIKQGEYFSRAEVLLAAVNRDYVEVEVIDENVASSLNMAKGERRAIYLKND